jgi:hypothetical protein
MRDGRLQRRCRQALTNRPSDREAVHCGHGDQRPLEATARGTGVVDGVSRVAMAEVILNEVQVVAFVGEGESARMTEHVRVDRRQPGAFGGGGNEIVR